GEVGNPIAVGSGGVKGAVENVRCEGADLPLTQVRRQTTTSRACFESLQPHQSLNPVETARQSLRQQVAPHPPRTIVSLARREAGAHLRPQRFTTPAAKLAATVALTA